MKKSKIVKSIFLTVLLVVLLSFSVCATNHVTDIRVYVTLNKDGSAHIHQEWTGVFTEGTECYYEFNLGDVLELENLVVSKDGLEYSTLDRWDVDASFGQKSAKCGLNQTGSQTYEVCWGITDYGLNIYTIDYDVKNMVVSYLESDGFNFRFINPGMNTGPTSAELTVSLADGTPITDEICNIWGFGYDGRIDFSGEVVYASTLSDLNYNNHMTVMMEFTKGVLTPAVVSGNSFESVKDEAFSGSDYSQEMSDAEFMMLILTFTAIIAAIFLGIGIWRIAQKLRKRKIKKEAPYYRETPKEDINTSYALLNSLNDCDESSIIAARLLRLILAGCIEPVDIEVNGIIGSKNEVGFRIVKDHGRGLESFDLELMKVLDASAGADDILEPDEMKNYCKKNPYSLRRILLECSMSGKEILKNLCCYKKANRTDVFNLTDNGLELLKQLYGLKKYLLDFSLIEEKGIKETVIWQDYMIYAVLFGIADEVAEELKKVYPEQIPEIETYHRKVIFANTCRYRMYSSMVRTERAEEQRRRSSGSGGRVSFGGGGGFSGGGFGGGTR